MNQLRLIFILAIFLASLLVQPVPAQATNNFPLATVVFSAQQQDEESEKRISSLGKKRGWLMDSSAIWTYQGQVGEVLTIKAEADKPANDAEPEERSQAGLLDMMLIVSLNGTIIAKADDIQAAVVTNAVIEDLALPTDGTYKIEVLGLQKEGSGAYTLTLQADSATLPEPTPTINPYLPTLTIKNELEETICYVYIWPTSADELGGEWLGTKKVVLPNDEHQWHVAPDKYNILLSDCYGNTLDQRESFDVTKSSALTALPSVTDEPEGQCSEGERLFHKGRVADALPQLEAGFAARESTIFVAPDDEGRCALALGILRERIGNREGALEAYQIALDIFQASGNREFEEITLNHIGNVYHAQGKYGKSLEYLKLSLEIIREVGYRANEGSTLNNIGLVYHAQGRYKEALEQYQEAFEITHKMRDRVGEGISLNNIGEVYRMQGKYEEALDYLERALDILREVGDHASEGITLNNIGLVYRARGKYGEALEYYQQALAILLEVGDRTNYGETLNNIAVVYDKQGKLQEALEYYQQALDILREVGNRATERKTLNNIAENFRAQRKYPEALEYYRQELDILREMGDRAGEGGTLNNIGLVYYAQRRYGKALEYYQQALSIDRKIFHRVGEGVTLHNIAAVYENQGRYGKALEFYQQALAIRREAGHRAGYGETLNNIGLVYRVQGKYPEALEYYQQALDILRDERYGVDYGPTLHNIAAIYRVQGKYPEALEYYQQALDILREVGDPAGEGVTLNNMAELYEMQGKSPKALETYQQALDILREVGDRVGEGVTLNNIGSVYDNQGRFPEALEYYQQALDALREVGNHVGKGVTLHNIGSTYEEQDQAEKALHNYEQAMGVFETLRTTAGGDEERASFIAQYADLYHDAINLYHQQGQEENAFFASERGRARSFLDSLTTGHVQLSDDELQKLLEEEQEAAERFFKANLELAQDTLDVELVAELEAAEEEYSKVQADIEARGDELAALVRGPSGVSTLAEVQALLDEETTLLSYWVLGDEGTLAFLITNDDLTVVELPDATPDNLTKELSGLYDWLNKDDPPKPLQNLHNWLVRPLVGHLQTPKVGLIPHQELHEVPFVALTDGQKYFGQQYTLFRLPSASALSHIQKNAANLAQATRPALVFGNPTTGDDFLLPLPHANTEAAKVAELLSAPVYTDARAHEARLWSDAVGAPIVHLAAHGSYNEINPLYSAIHLAPQGEYDGRLEVHEVYNLDLSSAEMVILSACESNVGNVLGNDDIVGLTRAFFFAGTPTLVSSLWNVDDAATEKLMSAFYRNWQGGMEKAEALQAAQAELRESETYSSPFYWAAFVLNGEPGEVSNSSFITYLSQLPFAIKVSTGIAALLFVVILILRWRFGKR